MTGLKTKTIKSVLRRRIDAWIGSLPDELKAMAREDTIVTGGCIASMLLGEKINDIDIYFRTKATTLAMAKYYVERFKANKPMRGGVPINIYVEELQDVREQPRVRIVVKSAGVESAGGGEDYRYFESRPPEEAGDYVQEVFDDPAQVADIDEEMREAVAAAPPPDADFKPVFLSSNSITLSRKIQVVIRFFGEPDEIHANYDFVHCTNYWEARTGRLVLRPEALEALLSRSLVYRGSRYPVASVIRLRKFIERGWRVNAGQIVKMALQIGELNLKSYPVLEDQLTGVDVAYFAEVLDKAKEKDPVTVDHAYLIEVVDRLFGN